MPIKGIEFYCHEKIFKIMSKLEKKLYDLIFVRKCTYFYVCQKEERACTHEQAHLSALEWAHTHLFRLREIPKYDNNPVSRCVLIFEQEKGFYYFLLFPFCICWML